MLYCFLPLLSIQPTTHRWDFMMKGLCRTPKVLCVSRIDWCVLQMLLTYYSPRFIKMEEEKWMCVACMDRKMHD
jgi:hypothetical protein